MENVNSPQLSLTFVALAPANATRSRPRHRPWAKGSKARHHWWQIFGWTNKVEWPLWWSWWSFCGRFHEHFGLVLVWRCFFGRHYHSKAFLVAWRGVERSEAYTEEIMRKSSTQVPRLLPCIIEPEGFPQSRKSIRTF